MSGRSWNRAWVAGIGMPDGWGPGPWDEDGSTWGQRALQSGDLRPWRPGDSVLSGPILVKDVHPPQGEGLDRRTVAHGTRSHYRHDQESLVVLCWCRRTTVVVAADVVSACLTESCGRSRCTSPRSLVEQAA